MTLAIATIHEGKAFVKADLRLSYDLTFNPVDGVDYPDAGLKIFFLGKSVAVAYAGTSQLAHAVLMQTLAELGENADAIVVAEFLRSKCQNHSDIEFLLARATSPVSIFKISSSVFSSAESGLYWIGDHEAANSLLLGDNIDPFHLEQRFQLLLDSQLISTVGGIVTSAFGGNVDFKFIPKLVLTSPYFVPVPTTAWQTVNWGNANTGGFGYTTLSPVEPGRNGCGVHFFQGNLGYFFEIDLEQGIFEKLVWKSDLQTAIASLQDNLGFDIESCGQLS